MDIKKDAVIFLDGGEVTRHCASTPPEIASQVLELVALSPCSGAVVVERGSDIKAILYDIYALVKPTADRGIVYPKLNQGRRKLEFENGSTVIFCTSGLSESLRGCRFNWGISAVPDALPLLKTRLFKAPRLRVDGYMSADG